MIELRGSFNEKWHKFQTNFIQEIDLIMKLKAKDTEQTIFEIYEIFGKRVEAYSLTNEPFLQKKHLKEIT